MSMTTSYLSGLASQVLSTHPTAVPSLIASGYAKYLWNYEPDSGVAKIASSYKVLALLVALPVIILGTLDIVSYGIARTLGVVDDVKASTSDKGSVTSTAEIPIIHINGTSTPSSESTNDSDREPAEELFLQARRAAASGLLAASQPKAFYASDSDGLGLAGADIFSPAASEPGSPTISRRTPILDGESMDSVDAKLQEGLRERLVQGEGMSK